MGTIAKTDSIMQWCKITQLGDVPDVNWQYHEITQLGDGDVH